MGKERRRHLHSQIDSNRIDLTHVTERIGSPQTQPNPSDFATNYQACLGPLRSLIAQGAFAGVGPFGEHFTGAVDPGAHYGTVGEAAFLLAVLGLTPDACATLVGS